MAQKPANQNLSEALTSVLSSTDLDSLYESYMDTLLSSLGRNITVYLPPGISQTATNPGQFNPWLRSKDQRMSGASEGGDGVVVEPIYVIYKAHIVHGPVALTKDIPFALDIGDVQITTVIGAYDDLSNAVEIEVDGYKFDIKKNDIRPIGFATHKYLISVWTKKAGT
jgi:hypothetical protein